MKHVSNDIYNTLLTLGRRIENATPQKKGGGGFNQCILTGRTEYVIRLKVSHLKLHLFSGHIECTLCDRPHSRCRSYST